MKVKKSTLITIIVLLAIFAPIAAYGTITHFRGPIEPQNVNHEFHFNGSLYFYDEAGNELGRYNCVSASCGNPKTIIDDSKYGIDYYAKEPDAEFAYHDDTFALIEDNGEIFIYSLKLNQKVITFEAIKNYNTNIEGNLLIAKNKSNGKWGIISLDSMSTVISYNYDFIGLTKHEDNALIVDDLIVLENNKWYIINSNDVKKSNGIDEVIKDYNDRYIISTTGKIYDYTASAVNLPFNTQKIYAVDKYLVLVNNDMVFVYEDLLENSLGFTTINNYEEIAFDLSDTTLNIYLDGTMGASIDLS